MPPGSAGSWNDKAAAMNDPRIGAIEVVRSTRARRISIRIRRDGGVQLVCPQRTALRLAWEFLESKIEWIRRAQARVTARIAVAPPLPPDEARARTESLRRAARADLPARLDRLSALSGLPHNGVTLRAMRTRWGSCSSRNTISLNIYLMELPEHLRDFVLLHELCHTVHHDHSARFHALLDRLCGGRERALNRELRRYTIGG